MNRIPAKLLATGDLVFFTKIGPKRILRISRAGNIRYSFIFDDNKRRSFAASEMVLAERGTDNPQPREGEILRFDRESKRTSVISSSLFGFTSEIARSFESLRGRVTTFPDIAALDELRRGALLFTEKAIYEMPQQGEKSCQ